VHVTERERQSARRIIDAIKRLEMLAEREAYDRRHDRQARRVGGLPVQTVRVESLGVQLDDVVTRDVEEIDERVLTRGIGVAPHHRSPKQTRYLAHALGEPSLEYLSAHGTLKRHKQGCHCRRCRATYNRWYREHKAKQLLERSRADAERKRQRCNGGRPTRVREEGFEHGGCA
jgi:hypothetical protein